eukprot:scaffold62448_cov36-Tisochrysis_lutea.AAC.1
MSHAYGASRPQRPHTLRRWRRRQPWPARVRSQCDDQLPALYGRSTRHLCGAAVTPPPPLVSPRAAAEPAARTRPLRTQCGRPVRSAGEQDSRRPYEVGSTPRAPRGSLQQPRLHTVRRVATERRTERSRSRRRRAIRGGGWRHARVQARTLPPRRTYAPGPREGSPTRRGEGGEAGRRAEGPFGRQTPKAFSARRSFLLAVGV